MGAGILKGAASALLGTGFIGVFYSQVLRPRLELLDPEPIAGTFAWALDIVPLPESRAILRVRSAEFSPNAGVSAAVSGLVDGSSSGRQLPAAFPAGTDGAVLVSGPVAKPRPSRDLPGNSGTAAPGAGRWEYLTPAAGLAGLDLFRGPAPGQVFIAGMSGPPPRGIRLPAESGDMAGTPLPPAGPDLPAGDGASDADPDPLLDVSSTLTPEPAALALLAGGLVALSLAGFLRRRPV